MLRLCLVFGLVLGFIGCDIQRGRFSMARESTEDLFSRVGCVQIVSGCRLKSSVGIADDEDYLLYILVVGREGFLHGGSNEFDNQAYVTIFNHEWYVDGETNSISIRWDRRADTVSTGKYKFAREKGNVLIIKLASNGDVTAQQLGNSDLRGESHNLLKYVRSQLPQDKVIASLSLLNDPRHGH